MGAAWLEQICDANAGDDRPTFVRSPRTMMVHGEAMTVASDSRCLVLVPGNHGYAFAPDHERDLLIDYTHPNTDGNVCEVEIGRFTRWIAQPVACERAGQHDAKVPCSTCNGTGKIDCECPDCNDRHKAACEDCRGTGQQAGGPCATCTYDPALGVQTERCGWIAPDVLVNRRLFDVILPHITDKTLTITTGNRFDPIFLTGSSGMWIVVMPMRHGGYDHVKNQLDTFESNVRRIRPVHRIPMP